MLYDRNPEEKQQLHKGNCFSEDNVRRKIGQKMTQ